MTATRRHLKLVTESDVMEPMMPAQTCRDRAGAHVLETGHMVTDVIDQDGQFMVWCDACEWHVIATASD